MAKNGQSYAFDFTPDIMDVNNHPEKYEQYRIKRDDDVATAADIPTKEEKERPIETPKPLEVEEINLNGKKYRKITGDEETIELNGVKYRAI